MRYVLPIFPFILISTSKLAYFPHHGRWPTKLLVWGALAWAIAIRLAIYPHSMSYFNEAAGGPENGQAHLPDSNIDWRQDLLTLKSWLDTHPEAKPLGLAFFHIYHLPPDDVESLRIHK
jgi:hypothetical protein